MANRRKEQTRVKIRCKKDWNANRKLFNQVTYGVSLFTYLTGSMNRLSYHSFCVRRAKKKYKIAMRPNDLIGCSFCHIILIEMNKKYSTLSLKRQNNRFLLWIYVFIVSLGCSVWSTLVVFIIYQHRQWIKRSLHQPFFFVLLVFLWICDS